MSGGYFNRHMIAFGEIANSIERDIARALQPKPEKIHKDYWTTLIPQHYSLTLFISA